MEIATKLKVMQDIYDKDYYEDGIAAGKSCYQNYQWMPEMTIRMAYNIIKYLPLKDRELILDYGCAKGYLVKALRILDIEAYGCDLSHYALEKVDSDVRDFCRLTSAAKIIPFDFNFDWIMTKDVLEHIQEDVLDVLLPEARKFCKKMFHVIPLGDDGQFRIQAYHDDPSHIQVHDEEWWKKKFLQHGWKLDRFHFAVKGIKENWTSKYPEGNGFFVLNKI